EANPASSGTAFVPTAVDRITVFATPEADCVALVELTEITPHALTGNVRFFNAAGETLVDLRGIHCRDLGAQTGPADGPLAWIATWEPLDKLAATSVNGPILLLGPKAKTTRLATLLKTVAPGTSVQCSENPDTIDESV